MVIPALAVLATGLFPRRTVLMWVPFAVLNDFDFVFNFFGYYVLGRDLLLHRAIFHNVFVGLPTGIVAYVLWRRMLRADPALVFDSWRARWNAFAMVPFGYGMVLATIFSLSHVFLDMFHGGVTPFWPIWNVYVYPEVFIYVDTQTGVPEPPVANVHTGEGAPALTPLYAWLTPADLSLLLLALIALVATLVSESRLALARRAVPTAGIEDPMRPEQTRDEDDA